MVETSDWEVGFTAAVPPHFDLCLKYGREQKRKVREADLHTMLNAECLEMSIHVYLFNNRLFPSCKQSRLWGQ